MSTKTYKVNRIKENQLIITGMGDNKLWEKANIITEFISPWDIIDPSPTEFKALWDSNFLFFCFKVNDKSIHIENKDDSSQSIGASDRVELFFRPDETLNPYYCLEIDPTARIMDFRANSNKNFDINWNWPRNELTVKSSIKKDHYTVEGSISISSLRKFGLIKENKIKTGIFRAKYNRISEFNFKPTWISWIDPNTDEPNFHISTSFGVLNLMK